MDNPNHKKVLGVIGSPRRGGNTEILVEEVLNGAKEAGAQIEKVILNELNITPCQGCGACQRGKRCIQQDDLPLVLEKMAQSQIWVLGTPVYWNGPTGQFKIFMDRWYSARRDTFNGKLVILAIPLGAGDPRQARHIVGMLTDSLGKDRIFETLIAPGAFNAGAVRLDTELMATARHIGWCAVEKTI